MAEKALIYLLGLELLLLLIGYIAPHAASLGFGVHYSQLTVGQSKALPSKDSEFKQVCLVWNSVW